MVYIYVIGIILLILLVGYFQMTRKGQNEFFDMGTYTAYSRLQQQQNKEPVQNVKAYIAVVRHGTRYPTKKVYDQLKPEIQAEVPLENIGNLTRDGYQEMLDYGRELIRDYPQIFARPERYLAFSTSVYRAKQSAQACLQGIGTKTNFEYGPTIDNILKINNFFTKEKPDPLTVSCLFAKLLGLNTDGCIKENISLYERRKNQLVLQSMSQNYIQAFPFYNILLDLIKVCVQEQKPRGYLFFAHDSTLSPLFYLMGLIDKGDYKNQDWLPFGARLEIFITYDYRILYYVNGILKKTLQLDNSKPITMFYKYD